MLSAIPTQIPAYCKDIPDRQTAAPFSPGERLSYNLRWSIFPVGEAVLEVLPMEIIDGASAYHFRLTVVFNAFVDLFYKVRDRIDGYMNLEIGRIDSHRIKSGSIKYLDRIHS